MSGISFDVTPDLEPEGGPLPSIALSNVLEARGIRGSLASEQDGDARLIEVLPLNGLVMAMHTAYSRHRPLVLGPDDVWAAIAQGLGRHVEEHAEALRSRLVRYTGKIALEVRRDELAASPRSVSDWAGAVDDLTAAAREHLGGRADLFVATFSTTRRASRVASQIALLGAVQSYFEYTVASLCGIPRVTLLGTPQDWANIRERVRVLGELELEWWAKELDRVLADLERTALGHPPIDFWQRAYKVHHASGGEAVSGWVNALFPYVRDRGAEKNPWFTVGDEANELELPKLRDYPCGLVSTPFTWRLLDGERPMRLVAGFVGVAEGSEGAVSPAIGWTVAPAMPERRFRAHPFFEGLVQLSPRDSAGLTSLEGLREEIALQTSLDGHARVKLSLSWSTQLTSLTGIEGVSAITAVDLLSCDSLTDIHALAELPSLEGVWIQQCPKLVDLGPLVALRRVKRLAVNHNPAIVDYSPLADLESLEHLDLFGNSVPAAFRGRHEGRAAVQAVQVMLRNHEGSRRG